MDPPSRLGPAEQQAARIGSLVFLTARGGQLVFSTAMVVNDWRRYRHPLLQAGLLAGCWAESAWLATRMTRRRTYEDRVGLWADAATGATALVASRYGLGDGAAAPWTKNIAIGAVIGAAGASSLEGGLAAAGVCAAGVSFGLGATGRESRVAGAALAVNDAVSWLGMHGAARVYLGAHRRYARLRDEADALALDRERAAAAAVERARHQDELHRITVDVLRRIAASTDLVGATALAAVEATRLRYALRAGGRLPAGLDRALAEVAGDPETGMHVELVTAELDGEPAPAVVAAVRDAVFSALSAAHQLGGASRAVLRASTGTEPPTLTVTIREHGPGFTAGAATGYEERLTAIGSTLAVSGVHLTWWSEPGEGVRVTIVAPLDETVRAGSAGGSGRDHPMDRVPDVGIGRVVAGHDADLAGHRDIEVGLLGRRFGSAQHKVGGAPVYDPEVRGARDALEAGSQQRLAGVDADVHPIAAAARRIGHAISVTRTQAMRVVSNTHAGQLTAAAAAEADRTLLSGVLSWRAAGLATGLVTVLAGRNRVRDARIAAAQVVAATAESAWLTRRALDSGRPRSRRVAGVDAVTAVALLASSYHNLEPDDRPTWLNWVPWSFATNALTLQAMDIPRSAGPLAPAAILAGEALQGPTTGDSIANVLAMTGFYAGARSFAGLIRTEALRVEQAQAEAIAAGRRLAVEQERAQALRLLHDNALQSLEAIAAGRYRDISSVAARLRDEADQLESGFQAASGPDALTRFESVLAAHRERGLRIEAADVDPSTLDQLAPTSVDALCGACHELLTNVAKHAGTDDVAVRLGREADMITLQVVDRGIGFDPARAGRGFGMRQSVRQRIADVGGRVDVRSAPGQGTQVTLRVPGTSS